MENSTKDCHQRHLPPRSKFNDEESTAVLRLIVEQERLLKNANVSPVLNISAEKLKRLPPLNAADKNGLANTGYNSNYSENRKTSSSDDIFINKPTLMKVKDKKGLCNSAEFASLTGKTKVPEIFHTPKLVRPRERERPRGARRSLSRSSSTPLPDRPCTGESIQWDRSVPTPERPSNPVPKFELERCSSFEVTRTASDGEYDEPLFERTSHTP